MFKVRDSYAKVQQCDSLHGTPPPPPPQIFLVFSFFYYFPNPDRRTFGSILTKLSGLVGNSQECSSGKQIFSTLKGKSKKRYS